MLPKIKNLFARRLRGIALLVGGPATECGFQHRLKRPKPFSVFGLPVLGIFMPCRDEPMQCHQV